MQKVELTKNFKYSKVKVILVEDEQKPLNDNEILFSEAESYNNGLLRAVEKYWDCPTSSDDKTFRMYHKKNFYAEYSSHKQIISWYEKDEKGNCYYSAIDVDIVKNSPCPLK
jgi:hypothetical protein